MRNSLGDKSRLLHIADSIQAIQNYIRGVDYPEFKSNTMMMDAVEKHLAVIGEASDHLSADLKQQYGSTEWFKIKGLRNRIIHRYFDIDSKIVWDIIKDDLPLLQSTVARIIKNF